MVAIDAGGHKRLNLLKDLKTSNVGLEVLLRFYSLCTLISRTKYYLFLCGLRMEDLVQFKDATLSFVQHSERGLVVGVCRHHHRLALLVLVLLQHRLHTTQHADVA